MTVPTKNSIVAVPIALTRDIDRLLCDDGARFPCSPSSVILFVREVHSRQKSLPCAINLSFSSVRNRSSGCRLPIVSLGLALSCVDGMETVLRLVKPETVIA